MDGDGERTVSSEELAERGHTTAAQVRKDLSHFGSFGKRGLGYKVDELRERLRRILGLDRTWRVVLIGAGRIGSALFAYPDFQARGYHCVAVVDNDPEKVGLTWGDVTIRDADELETVVAEVGAELAVLAVPAHAAQELASRATSGGVRGILNFAPIRLRTPPGVHVEDVSLVMELETLSFAITQAGAAGRDGGGIPEGNGDGAAEGNGAAAAREGRQAAAGTPRRDPRAAAGG